MNGYNVKPTKWKLCIICGERIADGQDLIGGQMKRGGTRCAHKACWEREQAELKNTKQKGDKQHD